MANSSRRLKVMGGGRLLWYRDSGDGNVLLCSPGLPGASYVNQAILKLRDLTASAPTPTPSIGKVNTIMPSIIGLIFFN